MAYQCQQCKGVKIQVRKFCWVWATDPDFPDEMGSVHEVDWECNDYEFWCDDCGESDDARFDDEGVVIEQITADEYRAIVAAAKAKEVQQ